MSELPDLPRAPRRTRPLPPGGLATVIRDGRRRRTRFLGATGGAVTAVVLVVSAVVASPSSSNDSLRFADPTPQSEASPEATPTDAATAEPSPQPQPAGSATPGGGSASPAPPSSPDASPLPEPTQAPLVVDRDGYVEEPRDVAAPATCRQPPGGSAGPVFYGGATACTSGGASDSTVRRGGQVRGTIDLCVAHGANPAVIGFDDGQEHEVTVFRGDQLVYRFSDTVHYPQGAHQREIGDGRCLLWTGVWDTTYTDGSLAPAGSYRVRVGVAPDTVNGRRTAPDEGSALEFSVTVEE